MPHKLCAFCGEEYSVQCNARMERSHYCSKSCRQKGRYAKGEWDMSKIRKPKGTKDHYKKLNCQVCGNEFVPNGSKQRYCRNCAPNHTWVARTFRYGVTKPIWDLMLKNQNGHCALCNKIPTVVDHNHKTGKTRGLLCSSCNFKIGALEEDDWVKKAEEYLAL